MQVGWSGLDLDQKRVSWASTGPPLSLATSTCFLCTRKDRPSRDPVCRNQKGPVKSLYTCGLLCCRSCSQYISCQFGRNVWSYGGLPYLHHVQSDCGPIRNLAGLKLRELQQATAATVRPGQALSSESQLRAEQSCVFVPPLDSKTFCQYSLGPRSYIYILGCIKQKQILRPIH